jgi:dTDP-4-dehydrorhamnose reductase
MKILIIGRGWTGIKLFAELDSRKHLVDICSHSFAFTTITKIGYDWIVNCAGLTGSPNVDACENNKQLTYESNTVFPIRLHEYINQYRPTSRFAHFSSGCIYTGNIDSKRANPNFFGSTYSISKGISDTYLRDDALVLRIRMPFTNVMEPKNYLTKVYNYAKNGKLIDAGKNSLTDLNEAVKVAADLIEKDASNGPYNLVNSGAVDMHELADMMGLTPKWYTEEEFKAATVAARSTCTIPDTGFMRPVKEALTEAIKGLKFE